jgi:hypothetical protein
MRRLSFVALFIAAIALTLSAQYQDRSKSTWIEPNSGAVLPEFDAFDSNEGTLGVLNASGPVKTEGHAFFMALGTNGRACVNCHQPTYGMSVSATALLDRWKQTDGKDRFAAFDGSNCPGLPGQGKLAFTAAETRPLPDCSGRQRTPTARRSRSSLRSKWCAIRPDATPVRSTV